MYIIVDFQFCLVWFVKFALLTEPKETSIMLLSGVSKILVGKVRKEPYGKDDLLANNANNANTHTATPTTYLQKRYDTGTCMWSIYISTPYLPRWLGNLDVTSRSHRP